MDDVETLNHATQKDDSCATPHYSPHKDDSDDSDDPDATPHYSPHKDDSDDGDDGEPPLKRQNTRELNFGSENTIELKF